MCESESAGLGPDHAPLRGGLPELQAALLRAFYSLVVRSGVDASFTKLPIVQVKCLQVIAAREGLSLRQAADALGVEVSSLSRAIDRLVRKDLVCREQDPQNRRAVRLTTTPAARDMLQRLWRARLQHLALCTQGLGDEELTAIAAALSRLAVAAEEALGDPTPGGAAGDPVVELMAQFPRTRRATGEESG